MEWVDPPPNRKGARSQHWREVVVALKAQPSIWAKVGNYSPGVATNIRRGKYPAFLGGVDASIDDVEMYMNHHWEITTSKTDEGKRNDIFIRWLG